MFTSTVEVAGDAPVIAKRATGSAAIEALRREGDRLHRATHPGVVPVVRSAPAEGGWELLTAHAGRAVGGEVIPVPQVASLAAGVAATLADLHAIGIVHGRLDASHVLLGPHGRPVLCGFGDGCGSMVPEDDVAALGRLVHELLGGDEELEPIPERRWRGRRRWTGWERRALLLLADQASADDPTRRPTARRLAAAISEVAPAAPSEDVEPDGADPLESRRRSTAGGGDHRRRRWRAPGLAVAGLAFVAFAISRPDSGPVGSTARPPAALDEVADTHRTAAPVEGSVLVADGRRFRVGEDGDHLLLGDWSCEGELTPAAFRPSTHEVFVFDRWTVDEALEVQAAATVPDSVEMVSSIGEDGCPTLAVRTRPGVVVPIDLGAFR